MGERKNEVFMIHCECCGSAIHIDPVERAIYYTELKDEKKRSMEEVVKDVTSVADRAGEKFDAGLAAEETREEYLEDLFRKGMKKAEEDPDKKPPSIWDYD
ncbi:MAG TPA: hypothetical protein EYN79_00405 [Planctomycetes bacterium]|nr:hypothetical protein [Planctomycetota bacterium]HIN80950.1 hypothetical protein [Planctomycetota bacterium]